jgi:hypothetical protein
MNIRLRLAVQLLVLCCLNACQPDSDLEAEIDKEARQAQQADDAGPDGDDRD